MQRADGNFVSNVRFEKREDAIRGPNGSITPGASTGQFANGQGISTNRNIAKSKAEEDARKKGYYISTLITNFLNFIDPGHSEKYTEHDEGCRSLWVWIKNNKPK